jgi:CBS domain-containing protein
MQHRAHGGATTLRRRAAAAAALVLVMLPALSTAAAVGFIQILKTSTTQEAGVWYLDADIAWSPGDEAREALDSGLTLDVTLTIVLTKRRRLLWDPNVAELEQRYGLNYHALTQRFIVLNRNSGEQSTHGSLQAALRAMGEVRRLPIIDDSLLEDDENYDVGLRAELDVKQLGGPLALISFLWNDWRVESEWERWPLER